MTSSTALLASSPYIQKYYVEERGWFTNSLKAVNKETFDLHQSRKKNYSFISNLKQSLTTLAIGILGSTQSSKFSIQNPGTGLVVSTLASYLWSHLPVAFAQTKVPMSGSPGTAFRIASFGLSTTQEYDIDLQPLLGGSFLVSWAGYTNAYVVSGRLFDGMGTVNETNLFLPNVFDYKITPISSGGFVVVGLRNKEGIEGQIFSNNAAKVGFPFRIDVNGTGASLASSNSIIGFTATWLRRVSTFNHTVIAQNFDSTGSKLGSGFQLDDTSVNGAYLPFVAKLSNGSTVLLWKEGIFACVGQLFDKTGAKIGNKFQINVMTTTSSLFPVDVVPLSGGGFVVILEGSSSSLAQGNDGWETYIIVLDAAGAQVGSLVQVSSNQSKSYSVDGIRHFPKGAPLPNGNFVIAWQSNFDEQKVYRGGNSIYCQVFDANGTKMGGQFKTYDELSPFPASERYAQFKPDVAPSSGGGFVVTWFFMSYTKDKTVYVYARFYPADFKGPQLVTQSLISSGSATPTFGTPSSFETARTTTNRDASSPTTILALPSSEASSSSQALASRASFLRASIIIGIASTVFAAT